MRIRTSTKAIGLLACLILQTQAQAALPNPGLTGTTQFDGWDNLTSANFPGYGSFPGSSSWPGPIGSNEPSSGDANLNRVAGGSPPGGPLPQSGGIYFGGFSSVPNTLGGTVSVTDTTPVSGVSTAVFQIEITEAFGFDFFNGVTPKLSYNGGSQNLASNYTLLASSVFVGTFPDPNTEIEEPIFRNTYVQQWDLTGLGATSLSIGLSGVQHSVISQLRLDQSNTFTWVPEPTSMALLAPLMLLARRGRRQAV